MKNKFIYRDENGLHLAPRFKRGFLSVIFSRFTIVCAFLALQVWVYVMMWNFFDEFLTKYFVNCQTAFVLIVLLILINSSSISSVKVPWLLLIAVFPFFGAVFYLWTQTDIGHRRMTKRLDEVMNFSNRILQSDEKVFGEIRKINEESYSAARYLEHVGNFPAYRAQDVRYYPSGETMFPALLAELKRAEKFIFLEYFIVEEGYMWGKILEILARKAAAGVEVRLLYDATCELGKIPFYYPKRLEAIGIRCRVWERMKPFITSTYNYRDHRKIAVIDGKTAFTGGINLSDEYMNRGSRFGYWKDTSVSFTGKAVETFTLMFLQMWNVSNPETEHLEKYIFRAAGADDLFLPASAGKTFELKPERDAQGAAAKPGRLMVQREKAYEGYIIPYGDSPLDQYRVGENIYMDILNTAEDYVYIMTPYLILDDKLRESMCFAAERGVDVRLIMPGIPDKKVINALSKRQYRHLLDAGVKIYEYTPGFTHAKMALSDSNKAVVGTINLDFRSFYHHFECAVYMLDVPVIKQIRQDFQDTLSRSRRVTRETLKKEKFIVKAVGAVVEIIAPML